MNIAELAKFATPEGRTALKNAVADFYGTNEVGISTPVKRMRNIKAKKMYHKIIDDVSSMREEEKKKEA